jgi:hypothetical protein
MFRLLGNRPRGPTYRRLIIKKLMVSPQKPDILLVLIPLIYEIFLGDGDVYWSIMTFQACAMLSLRIR